MFENLHNFPLLYIFGIVVGILISVYCCPLFSCFAYNGGNRTIFFLPFVCVVEEKIAFGFGLVLDSILHPDISITITKKRRRNAVRF